MKRASLILFITVWISSLSANSIDTLKVYSQVMEKFFPVIVVLPDDYNSTTFPFPVVYLLHGYSGDYSNWAAKADLKFLANKYQSIIVCPEGGYDSWYFDSPVEKDSQFKTFVGKELIEWVDRNFLTIAKKEGRAITGLSMGGHGALYLTITHPDNYIAIGSMSGVMDLTETRFKNDILMKLDAFSSNGEVLKRHSIINLVEQLSNNSFAILIECGVEDRYIGSNRNLHSLLVENNIPHDYIERPGGHSWEYWVNALEYHLLFFQKVFNQVGESEKK